MQTVEPVNPTLSERYGVLSWPLFLPKLSGPKPEEIGWCVVGVNGMPLAMGMNGMPLLYAEGLAKSRASTRPGAKAVRVMVKS